MTVSTHRQPIRSSAVWRPRDIADPSEWSIELTDDERAEIVAATIEARATGATIETVDREAFPLPTLGQRVNEWSELLDSGRGFLLLRQFPIDLLDEDDTELAYVGLGTHFGKPVSQNATGDLLGHVRDERAPRTGPEVRLYTTNQRQDFHTDGSDLVGLLCLHRARSGGESRIASSHAVYNELLRRRPELVDELYRPLPWDRNDEQSEGEDPYFLLPPFTDVNGVPRVFYIGWYVRDSQRHADAPRLAPAQLEAMQLMEEIANDPAFHLEMDFAPGDIQLLNNAKILHSRESYTDADDPAERRHLLRLWLTAHAFSSVEDVLRGGIPERR